LRGITYQRTPLYPKQEAFLYTKARYSLVEASTKTGKTHGALVWQHERSVRGKRGGKHWWVAPVLTQAKIAFGRIIEMMPRRSFTPNFSDHAIKLIHNKAVWTFKGSDRPDSLYGEDVEDAVLDEGTRMREEAWNAIRSTLTATRGPARILANVKGRRNWMYRMSRHAEAAMELPEDHLDRRRYHYAKLTALDAVAVGILSIEEIEDARETLQLDVFDELYMAIPSEDGSNPFGMGTIAKQTQEDLEPGPVVAWGVDLAKTVDWTVAVGLNAGGRTARFERWRLPWADTLGRLRTLIGTTPAYVDSTGVGDPIVEFLQKSMASGDLATRIALEDLSPLDQAKDILRRRAREATEEAKAEAALDAYMGGAPNVVGYQFTKNSRQRLLEYYALALQRAEVAFVRGDGDVVVKEHEAFEVVYTPSGARYQVPEGQHDDTVMAYALAAWCQREAAGMVSAGGAQVDL